MALHLVTGYAGKNHVTSADQGAFNASLLVGENCVLNRGSNLAASVVTNNLIKISDGEIVMQGRHIRLENGSYEEVAIDNGTQDYKRNDLIVIRYAKSAENGVESVTLEVLKGTPSASSPVDPEHNTGDTLGGDLISEFPLYRVPIDGLNVGTLEPLFEVVDNFHSQLKKKADLTDDGTLIANAEAVADTTIKQVRNIYAGTSDMTAGTTALASGDIYVMYE